MNDEPFDAIDKFDGFVATRVTFYAALYPRLRQRARELGYALALHGSLAKDLDVLAVPWVEDAAAPHALVRALTEAAGGSCADPGTTMPHGRRAFTIRLGKTGGYVDLSIVPPEDYR